MSHTPETWEAFTEDGKFQSSDPWFIENDDSHNGFSTVAVVAPTSAHRVVAVIPVEGWPADEGILRERARLIAAAPELLEALEKILPFYKSFVDECGHDPSVGIDCTEDFNNIEDAEAAITKARGES